MVPEVIAELISSQRNRPLSVALVVFALFLPSSLTIFLSKPQLYTLFGLSAVILLSLSISLPIVLLCYAIWYTPLSALLKAERLMKGEPSEPADMAQALRADDPLEWPCLLIAGWMANLVLFVIAAIAYMCPLRIGATYLLTAAILFGIWALLIVRSRFIESAARRRWKPRAGAARAPNG